MTPPIIPPGLSPSEYAGSLGVDEDGAYERLLSELHHPLRVLPPRTGHLLVKRSLREYKGDEAAAAAAIRASLEWRSKGEYVGGCKICNSVRPGAHPMRQVGFDRHGRAVVYCCFAQAWRDSSGFGGDAAHGHFWTAENLLPHLMHTLDNAALSVQLFPFLKQRITRLERHRQRWGSSANASSTTATTTAAAAAAAASTKPAPSPPTHVSDASVWVVDFTGFRMSDLTAMAALGRPAYAFANAHYCLALARVVCFNTPTFFHTPWKLVSRFLPEVTKRKITFLGTPRDGNDDDDDPNVAAAEAFLADAFGGDEETADWLREEVRRNRELDAMRTDTDNASNFGASSPLRRKMRSSGDASNFGASSPLRGKMRSSGDASNFGASSPLRGKARSSSSDASNFGASSPLRGKMRSSGGAASSGSSSGSSGSSGSNISSDNDSSSGGGSGGGWGRSWTPLRFCSAAVEPSGGGGGGGGGSGSDSDECDAVRDLRRFARVRDQGADGFWRCGCALGSSSSSAFPSPPPSSDSARHDPRGAPAYVEAVEAMWGFASGGGAGSLRKRNSSSHHHHDDDDHYHRRRARGSGGSRDAQHRSRCVEGVMYQPHPNVLADIVAKGSGGDKRQRDDGKDAPSPFPPHQWGFGTDDDESDAGSSEQMERSTDEESDHLLGVKLYVGKLRPRHRPDRRRGNRGGGGGGGGGREGDGGEAAAGGHLQSFRGDHGIAPSSEATASGHTAQDVATWVISAAVFWLVFAKDFGYGFHLVVDHIFATLVNVVILVSRHKPW